MANQYLKPVIAIPSALEITAITNSYPMVVTTTLNSDQVNTYIVGQLVRLNIPYTYGMFQANGLNGTILALSGSDFSLDIDSSQFDSFYVPSSDEQPASLAPSGSRNLTYSNLTNDVPFQSLNNIGN